jgi:hypothetical protein
VIVKALVSRHIGKGADRAAALAKHVVYLGRSGAGVDGARPEFFDRDRDGVRPQVETEGWSEDRHHFRFIVSPEHGDRLDLKPYVREVMARVSADLGEPGLNWIATCHYDTDQPHAHVLVRGRRGDGRDLVIPRDYMGYGFPGAGPGSGAGAARAICRGSMPRSASGRRPRPTGSPGSTNVCWRRRTPAGWLRTGSGRTTPGRR